MTIFFHVAVITKTKQHLASESEWGKAPDCREQKKQMHAAALNKKTFPPWVIVIISIATSRFCPGP
eukprot:8021867-Karenia_brevis.AAC.1